MYATLAMTLKGGERIALQGFYQTRANAKGAAMTVPPVCLPSTKDSFMACRHHVKNSSDLERGISLPQVLVMSTMQTQALYAVLRDFDLDESRRGCRWTKRRHSERNWGCASRSRVRSAS